MKRKISKFVAKYLMFQQMKAEHKVPSSLLQLVMIPKWKREHVTMPVTQKKKNAIWEVVDKLTKSVHFIPVRTGFSLDKLAKLYVAKIVRLHDRDPWFTSRFWGKLHETLCTKLNFSTTFHPQIDEQFERVIHILENMLRYGLIEFESS
ncbi:Gag protease polyprotein [Gossypium australe]|uniref:Gag protease polyprotein n=1 Tax=Gossypium australe TaxID=47621 RepID=A0A5B6WFF6_9ROSI|nr:Gag protease polyprotein [Gossypium australe]